MNKVILLLAALAVLTAAAAAEMGGIKKRRPLPDEYGRVVINNHSEKAKMAPVVFDHWFHRANFTCRLCHVDIGFEMGAGGTGIKAVDNIRGYYCGTCHNGRMPFAGRKVFAACSPKPAQGDLSFDDRMRCERCHSLGLGVKREYDFYTYTAGLPKERFGNGIDWEKAENQRLIKLTDYIEGASVRRKPFEVQKDFSIKAKIKEMPEIIFSHEKHIVWNGCEVCHPDIFTVRKGGNKLAMTEIFEGKYCGACHGKVSFPMLDCQRCHTAAVQ
jgi:c(7)-type cytochrome triheme protein